MDKQEERLHLIFSETFFTHSVNKPVNNVAGYYMQKDLVKSNKIQLEVCLNSFPFFFNSNAILYAVFKFPSTLIFRNNFETKIKPNVCHPESIKYLCSVQF